MIKVFFFILLSFPTITYAQNTVFEPVLTGSMASKMVQAASTEAEKIEFKITIIIVDNSGQTLAVLRHENAGFHTFLASYKKQIRFVRKERKQL